MPEYKILCFKMSMSNKPIVVAFPFSSFQDVGWPREAGETVPRTSAHNVLRCSSHSGHHPLSVLGDIFTKDNTITSL